MFFYILCRLLSALFAFLYPAYSSFKALSRRPVTEQELERWVMYWAIIGIIVSVEYSVEWLVDWFPFYWEVKTAFLLFLALPQTQGSTWVYRTYLAPFLTQNEATIDERIMEAQTNVFAFAQSTVATLWEKLTGTLNRQATQTPTTPGQAGSTPAPASGLMGMWRTYGPTIIAAGNSILGPKQQQPPNPGGFSSTPLNLPPQMPNPSTSDAELRRRNVPETPGSSGGAPPPFPVPQVGGYQI